MAEYDFTEGLDPTPLGVISASQLLQMVRQALPKTNKGIIIYQDTEPNVIADPRYKGYIWIRPSDAPKIIKLYNEVTEVWEPNKLEVGIITGDNIQNGSVGVDKLTPGTPTYLLRTNLAGVVEWFKFTIDDNSIALSKIVKSLTPGQLVRTSLDGSQIQWFTLNPLDYIDFGGIGLAFLEQGGPRQIPRMDSTGANANWEDLPTFTINNGTVQLIKLVPGLPGQIIRTNEANNAEWKTIYFDFLDSASLDTHIAGLVEIAHNFGVVPTIFQVRLVCITDDPTGGCVVGDELDVNSIQRNAGNDSCFQPKCSSSKLSVQVTDASNDFNIRKLGAGNTAKLTPANYKLRFTATCFKFI